MVLFLKGKFRSLENFEVPLARDKYRAVDHKYEMRFTSWTTVNKIDPAPAGFPLHAYKIRTFQSIMENVTDKTFLVDVLVITTGVSELLSADVKGRITSRRILRLTDTRHTSIVYVGANAEKMDAHALVRLSEREPVIVLIMGCTFRMQDGMFGPYRYCLRLARYMNRSLVFRVSRIWVARQLIDHLKLSISTEGFEREGEMVKTWMRVQVPPADQGLPAMIEEIVSDLVPTREAADESLGKKRI
ncbi:hypothetical protein BRADI_4g19440v3 [Brachypodium distachyon]|uniref:Uncharacterized protein n=1 Tax=Brachypodium distachyon TaxID=15368 RepID=I1ILT4_BRADI|nr:hypothetical protein BRADI_4g19440v3 [Brachypodium distachyon]